MTVPGLFSVNADGSVSFNGTVTWPNGFANASGMGVVIFSNNDGFAWTGAIAQGQPGLPSPPTTVTATQLASTASPTATATVTNPGGAGSVAQWTLALGIPAGIPGTSGSFALHSATDLTGAAVVGDIPVVTGTGPTAFGYQPQLVGGYQSVTGISASASNNTTPKNLAAIAVAAQPFAWWPEVSGQALIIGASDTRVDLVARLSSTSGTIVGYGLGQAGAAPCPTIIQPQGLAPTGSQIVAANTAATVFFNAENQTASINNWSVSAGAFFSVKVCPVP